MLYVLSLVVFYFCCCCRVTRPFWILYKFFREEHQTRINFFYIKFFYNEHHTEYTSKKKEVQSITFFIFSLLDSFFFCTTHCLALYQIINSVLNPLFYFIYLYFFLWMKEQKKIIVYSVLFLFGVLLYSAFSFVYVCI